MFCAAVNISIMNNIFFCGMNINYLATVSTNDIPNFFRGVDALVQISKESTIHVCGWVSSQHHSNQYKPIRFP